MRLVEVPRPKPVIRIPEPPVPDPDIPELADFPTDLVNPAILAAKTSEPRPADIPRGDAEPDRPAEQDLPEGTDEDPTPKP